MLRLHILLLLLPSWVSLCLSLSAFLTLSLIPLRIKNSRDRPLSLFKCCGGSPCSFSLWQTAEFGNKKTFIRTSRSIRMSLLICSFLRVPTKTSHLAKEALHGIVVTVCPEQKELCKHFSFFRVTLENVCWVLERLDSTDFNCVWHYHAAYNNVML